MIFRVFFGLTFQLYYVILFSLSFLLFFFFINFWTFEFYFFLSQVFVFKTTQKIIWTIGTNIQPKLCPFVNGKNALILMSLYNICYRSLIHFNRRSPSSFPICFTWYYIQSYLGYILKMYIQHTAATIELII